MANDMNKTDEEWRRELSAEQFAVCRRKGTEAPVTGAYWDSKEPGIYRCACCGEALFDSGTKFDSGTGWPSFYAPVAEGQVASARDTRHGMTRTEVVCSRCGAHLGDFDDVVGRATAVRLQNRKQMTDAVLARRAQHREVVIDEQRARGVEALTPREVLPEGRSLFRITDVVGALDGVELSVEPRGLELQCETFIVRVGDEHRAPAGRAQRAQEIERMRVDGDEVRDLALQQADVEIELAAPVVDAIPVERALAAAEHEREHGLGRDHVEPAALGVAAGQQLLPELVVIVEVEQGTVHVEQHRINLIPSHPVLPPPQRIAVVVYWPPIRVGSNVDRAIMPQKPRILSAETVARTRLFHVEEVGLEFSNGKIVRYERLRSSSPGAVLIVPLLDDDTVLLIREYAAGVHRYELALPKGLIEPGEDILEAANREMQEEVGYAARRLEHITSLTLAPGYFGHVPHAVRARDPPDPRRPGPDPAVPVAAPRRPGDPHAPAAGTALFVQ